MTFRKRALLWWGIILIAVLAGIWPAGYFYSLTEPAELRPAPLACRPDGKAELGGSVTVSTVCDLPLWSPPPVMAVTPPENMVAAGAPRVRGAWRWCRRRWTLEAVLRPIRPGAAAGGQLEISAGKAAPAVLELPGWTVEPAASDRGEPVLADELPVPSKTRLWWYLAAGAALLAAAVVLVWCFRRHREAAAAPPPVWERAENELLTLEEAVRARRIAPPPAFVQLTEVVRRYLEERYALPARARTTDEFLDFLRRSDAPLPAPFRPFLDRFLRRADLVKFARQEPEEAPLLAAVEEARELVRRSIPEQSPEKGGQNV